MGTINGTSGADVLHGAAGDSLYGGLGNDTYIINLSYPAGGSGAQGVAYVGEEYNGGIDTVQTNALTYSLGEYLENLIMTGVGGHGTGNALANTMSNGGTGGPSSSLDGGSGDDVLTGDGTLDGGSDRDTLIWQGASVMDGGPGNDSASFQLAPAGVTVDLGLSAPQATGGAGTVQLVDIELLTGSNFNDVLANTALGFALTGGGGDDLLIAAGDDSLFGGSGNDTASFARLTYSYGVSVDLNSNGLTQVISNAPYHTIQLSDVENLIGTSKADTLKGNAGANVLTGGGGNDNLFGGAGSDTAAYVGLARAYALHMTGANGTVVGAAEGTDTLTSMENLSFRDGVLTFDADSAAAVVMRMYDTALHRAPDTLGLQGWTHAYESGQTTLAAMASAFSGSAEFKAATTGMSQSQLVTYMYVNTLHRQPDSTGLTTWLNYLNSGHGVGDLVLQFSESAEHRSLTAATVAAGLWDGDTAYQNTLYMYEAAFGRLPDQTGLINWANALKGGLSLHGVAVAFTSSGEFYNATHALTHRQLVDYLYQTALHRPADGVGETSWTIYLDNGGSVADLLLQFEQSNELQQLNAANIDHGIGWI